MDEQRIERIARSIAAKQVQIVNDDGGYFSVEMGTGKPKFLKSPAMGYFFEKREAEKILKQLKRMGYENVRIAARNPAALYKMMTKLLDDRVEGLTKSVEDAKKTILEVEHRYPGMGEGEAEAQVGLVFTELEAIEELARTLKNNLKRIM